MSKKLIVLIIVILVVAVAAVIIASTAAWFSNKSTVETGQAVFSAAESEEFTLDVPPVGDYHKYMGETGLKPEPDLDAPYMLEYFPLILKSGLEEEKYLQCVFSDASFIEKITAVESEKIETLSIEQLLDNFTFRFILLEKQPDETYLETENVYKIENGYLRNAADNSLLLLERNVEFAFKAQIYFQGEEGLRLLEDTNAAIDEKYIFDYCDEEYMFSTFCLYALFSSKALRNITFETLGYDSENVLLDDTLYHASSVDGLVTTGKSLIGPDGVEQNYPTPEIYLTEADCVDYSKTFEDWLYLYYEDELTPDPEYRIYRKNKEAGAYSLATDPIQDQEILLHAKWGESNEITVDYLLDGVEETIIYVRPKGRYYKNGGYLTFDQATGVLTAYNPSGENDVAPCVAFPEPTQEGYLFAGWSTVEGGTTANAFTELNNYKIGDNASIYAIWKEAMEFSVYLPDETWGTTTLSNISATMRGKPLSITDSYATAVGGKGEKLVDVLSELTAEANINRNGENIPTTVSDWCYKDGENWIKLDSSSTVTLTEGVEVKPIWAGRGQVAVTLDLVVNFGLSSQYFVYGRLNASNGVIFEGYEVTFEGNEVTLEGNRIFVKTIDFTGSREDQDVIINVPEGVSIYDLNLDISIGAQETAINVEYFKGWSTTENEGKVLAIGTLNNNADSYTDAINEEITLYAYFGTNDDSI